MAGRPACAPQQPALSGPDLRSQPPVRGASVAAAGTGTAPRGHSRRRCGGGGRSLWPLEQHEIRGKSVRPWAQPGGGRGTSGSDGWAAASLPRPTPPALQRRTLAPGARGQAAASGLHRGLRTAVAAAATQPALRRHRASASASSPARVTTSPKRKHAPEGLSNFPRASQGGGCGRGWPVSPPPRVGVLSVAGEKHVPPSRDEHRAPCPPKSFFNSCSCPPSGGPEEGEPDSGV